MENITKVGVGVDVSKDKLDVFIYPIGQCFSVANTSKGIKQLLKKLENYNAVSVGCEASGGYEAKLVEELCNEEKMQVFKINPDCVYGFKKALGLKAKTDEIDAEIIARFVLWEGQNTKALKKVTPEDARLKNLFLQREHFKKMLAQTRTYLQAPLVKEEPSATEKVIRRLEVVIKSLTTQIDLLVKNNPSAREKIALITSIPGCGPEVGIALVVLMPEAGIIENKQLSSLIGLAPFSRESGEWAGKRYIRYGRPIPRKKLYMCALSASRHNPVLSKFYEQLIAKGKPKKVALIAVARRLICIINAVLRDETPWRDMIVIN